jgi:hypothetical protein
MMTGKRWARFALAAVFSFGAAAALAHHGGAAYDSSKMITVTGKVTEFKFVNPHVLISIAVAGEGGEVVEWSGELTSPNRLARMAQPGSVRWTKEILKPGDEIELTGNPAVSGAPALRLHKVVDSTGTAIIGGDG